MNQCTMQDGWYVDEKCFFIVFLFGSLTMMVSYALTIHMLQLPSTTKCFHLLTYLPTYLHINHLHYYLHIYLWYVPTYVDLGT
jgi:hypothetical protein